MNARAIARHYAMLAGHGVLDGTRILSEARVNLIRTLQTDAPDEVYGVRISKALGYFLGGDANQEWSRAMGRSGKEFGHPGLGGSTGFADPENGLGFGFTKNLMKADDKTARTVAEAIREHLNGAH
jgi:CubicO group peptidase (beta-lactamase class C family)